VFAINVNVGLGGYGVRGCSARFVGVAKNLRRKGQWKDPEDESGWGGSHHDTYRIGHVVQANFFDFVKSQYHTANV